MLTPAQKGQLTRLAKSDSKRLTGSRDHAKVIATHERDNGASEATRYYAGALHKVL